MKQIADLIQGHPLFRASSSDSVRDVARQMSEKNIGAVAVLDGDRLVGIFSERDIMTRVVAAGLDPGATPVSNVMTKDVVVAAPLDDVSNALSKMRNLGCRHLPVVDRGNLIGMLSLRDLLLSDGETSREKATFLRELVTYSPDYDS